jgi:hypothetical protein
LKETKQNNSKEVIGTWANCVIGNEETNMKESPSDSEAQPVSGIKSERWSSMKDVLREKGEGAVVQKQYEVHKKLTNEIICTPFEENDVENETNSAPQQAHEKRSLEGMVTTTILLQQQR